MAWYQTNIGGGSGNTTVQPVLIGNFTSATTSAVTRTLTQSIDNFKYLWFSLYPITSDSVWLNDTTATSQAGYAFCDVEYFKTHPVTLAYTTGSTGSASYRTAVITYVDGTTITSQFSNTGSRNLYVYGIKDMPRGRLEETVLWTNSSPTSSFAAQDVTLSQSYKTFDYIKVTARMSTTSAVETSVIIPLNDFDLYYPTQKASGGINVHRTASDSASRTRAFGPVGETTIHFFTAFSVATSGAQENGSIIPVKISGLK